MSEEREIGDVLDATVQVTDEGAEALLREGRIDVLGRMPWSSNGTFLVTVSAGERRCQAIYKPEAGERPLWDFPPGLWRREVATYVVARQLGWDVVPPTVVRHDAELGVGSVQFFVPSRFEEHYFTFRDDPSLRGALHRICVLDMVTNNTDRKGGHILLAHDGRVWGIDHGLSFHADDKLRTVMWDFAGTPIDADIVDDLADWVTTARTGDDARGDVPGDARRGPEETLAELLDDAELDALVTRVNRVIASATFPRDPSGQRYPWPLV